MTDIAERLEDLRERDLYRRMRLVSGPQGPRVLLDGRPVLLLCSNNYLGLADHPRVRAVTRKPATGSFSSWRRVTRSMAGGSKPAPASARRR